MHRTPFANKRMINGLKIKIEKVNRSLHDNLPFRPSPAFDYANISRSLAASTNSSVDEKRAQRIEAKTTSTQETWQLGNSRDVPVFFFCLCRAKHQNKVSHSLSLLESLGIRSPLCGPRCVFMFASVRFASLSHFCVFAGMYYNCSALCVTALSRKIGFMGNEKITRTFIRFVKSSERIQCKIGIAARSFWRVRPIFNSIHKHKCSGKLYAEMTAQLAGCSVKRGAEFGVRLQEWMPSASGVAVSGRQSDTRERDDGRLEEWRCNRSGYSSEM